MPYGIPVFAFRRMLPTVFKIRNFAAGTNLRDWQGDLNPTESSNSFNCTLDERGVVGSRLGRQKWNAIPYVATLTQNGFYSDTLTVEVIQCGATLFKDHVNTTVRKTFSTTARVGFTEFNGAIYVIHPVDGVFYTSDAVTWTAIVGSPVGTLLKAWQNRILSSGDPAHKTRVTASAIGDGLNWSTVSADRTGTDAAVTNASTTVTSATAAFVSSDVSKKITLAGVDYHIAAVTNSTTIVIDSAYAATTGTGKSWSISGTGWFNDFREKNDSPIVNLEGASGVDIQGRPGLCVFKNNWTGRIHDSNTGAYDTLDAHIGTASGLSVVSTMGRIFTICEQGIFSTDGISSMKPVSQQEEPLWNDAKLAFDQLPLWCAGVKGDRIHFSVPENGQTTNTLSLEYHPAEGWIMFGSNAVSFYLSYGKNSDKLLGGSPTVNGQVYELFKGGSDDGTAIHSWFETAWFQPFGGTKMRVRRVRPTGRGTFTLYFKVDYENSKGSGHQVVIKTGQTKWGAGAKWGDGTVWGVGTYFGLGDPIDSLGVCRAFAFRAEATTTNSTTAPPLLDGAYSAEVGAWALSGLDVHIVQLGLS